MANSNSSAESSGSLVQSPRFVGICNHSRFYKNLFVRSVEGPLVWEKIAKKGGYQYKEGSVRATHCSIQCIAYPTQNLCCKSNGNQAP